MVLGFEVLGPGGPEWHQGSRFWALEALNGTRVQGFCSLEALSGTRVRGFGP